MIVFPGYTRLMGPETLALTPDRRVQSPRDYRLWQFVIVGSRGGTVWTTRTKVRAYINAGRWVAVCAYCRKAMFTRPDWRIACCGECGAFYGDDAVVFPLQVLLDEVVPLLLKRPNRDTQNWGSPHLDRPIQTPSEVARENVEVCQC